MKFSLASTLLILVVGGAVGFLHHRRLDVLETDHRQLVEKADQLGISLVLTTPSGDPRITKRQRDGGGNEAQSMTAELIAFARKMEKEKASDHADDSRAMELMNRLMSLDPSQLKAVIAGLRDDKSLSDDSRRNMVGFSMMILAEHHPASALALFVETSDLLGVDMIGQQIVSSSLKQWAKDDPAAALDWISKNQEAHPDVTGDDAKRGILTGVSQQDPKLAFKLMEEMDLDDPSEAVGALVESGKTPEQRTAILSALRDHLATLPKSSERDDILEESLESMGRNLSNESFDAVKTWITDAGLSQKESAQFAAGLSYFNTKQDTGRWIDWMAENLPVSDARECADNLIGQWTQQDYLAAGQWLAAAAEGPTKNASVATYAETVAEYDPQVAVQWALRLPEGTERKSTLTAIYQNWPATDAAGATRFARQYGIDPEADKEDP